MPNPFIVFSKANLELWIGGWKGFFSSNFGLMENFANGFKIFTKPSCSCHAPNPILGFVTMTGMLISSLNLILTRTNLTFSKTFTKAFLFLFILVSLLKWYNFPLDFQSIYIVPQRITQSTDYSNSKFYIIHLLIL